MAMVVRILILCSFSILLTFCKSKYKTASATLPNKDRVNTTKQDQRELKKHMEKQEQKVIESEDIENKYLPPSKRKKRGEIPPQETFY